MSESLYEQHEVTYTAGSTGSNSDYLYVRGSGGEIDWQGFKFFPVEGGLDQTLKIEPSGSAMFTYKPVKDGQLLKDAKRLLEIVTSAMRVDMTICADEVGEIRERIEAIK